jgi:hypothetical protein
MIRKRDFPHLCKEIEPINAKTLHHIGKKMLESQV